MGKEYFSIKQLYGRYADLDLDLHPALLDYAAEPANKIIVDMVTSESKDIDYSGMFLRSFAAPTLFFTDVKACTTSTSLYELSRREHPECYQIIDCSGVMISPNILMTAGHCTCLGFGRAGYDHLPIYDDPVPDRTAKVLFRSYINLGQPIGAQVDFTDPANYIDEYFNCFPIYEGWRDFIPNVDPSLDNCNEQELDVSFLWCENSIAGVAPGDKYGFVDYEVDHFRKLMRGRTRIITDGYPSQFLTLIFPLNPNELFYSLWQNPFYMNNYWNPGNLEPYVNLWDDYFLFYGHKLVSEGTCSSQSGTYDNYKIYAQHGASGSPAISFKNKMSSGPAHGMVEGSVSDSTNLGLEENRYPETRRSHLSMRSILTSSLTNFDVDEDFILDFMETGGDHENIDLPARYYYFLPLHDWYVRRGLWRTENLGSLFWNGSVTPFDLITVFRGFIYKVPFGVVKSRTFGEWRLICGPPTWVCHVEYVNSPPERCLYSSGVPLEPDTEYGVVVKFINTYSSMRSKTLLGMGQNGESVPLEPRTMFTPTYNTVFFITGAAGENNVQFEQQGPGLTFIENVSVFKVDNNATEANFSFESWDEREIWKTWDGKSSEFWPWTEYTGAAPSVGWVAVLLPTLDPERIKNLTTYYIPFKAGMHYYISFRATSNRLNTVAPAGIIIELRDANDHTMVISSASIESSEVGHIHEGHFYWTDHTVELFAQDISGIRNDSYYFVIRRGEAGLYTVFLDDITVEEAGTIAPYSLPIWDEIDEISNGSAIIKVE